MTLSLKGTAGGAEANLRAGLKGRVDDWHAAGIDIELGLQGPDGGKLLQQLGFDVIPIEAVAGGNLQLTAKGVPADGMAIDLAATVGASELGANGTLTLKEGSDPEYRATVSANTPDLAPLALMAGRVLPMMTGMIPADLSLEIEGVGSAIALPSVSGSISGTSFEGRLEGDMEPAPGERNRRFAGELSVSEADLRNLTELVLGPDQWFSAGDGSSIWPVASFGAPLLDGIDLAFDFHAGRLLIDETTEIANADGNLRISPTLLRLDGLKGAFAGGSLEGSLSLTRTDAEAALSGRVKLEDANLRQLVWRPDNRAVASGTMDLFLEYEGVGRSISAIVSGLSGGGTFSLENGDFRGLSPQAFPLVTRAVDAGLDLRDEKDSRGFRQPHVGRQPAVRRSGRHIDAGRRSPERPQRGGGFRKRRKSSGRRNWILRPLTLMPISR
ncbi:AsmA-like C-terminal region-containing protein [Roseibium salinum]|nr:AsmA-like C-terminal region-containing protein [Roseibium salinum]